VWLDSSTNPYNEETIISLTFDTRKKKEKNHALTVDIEYEDEHQPQKKSMKFFL